MRYGSHCNFTLPASKRLQGCLIAIIFFFLFGQVIYPGGVMAEEPLSPFSGHYVRLLVSDATHILTAPKRWDREDWRDVSMYAAGVGAVMLLDKPVYEEVQRNRTESIDDFASTVQDLGSYPSFGIMGAFYVAGALLENERARTVAMDAFASSLVSAGMITTTLKVAAGRSRPNEEEGAYRFKPFGGHHSFPSGHTTQAFSLASVIAKHYDERWIDITSYGIATLIGLARIEQEAHFPSDVVAGAVIGTLVGKAIVRYNKGFRTGITLTPAGDGQTMGAYLRIEF